MEKQTSPRVVQFARILSDSGKIGSKKCFLDMGGVIIDVLRSKCVT